MRDFLSTIVRLREERQPADVPADTPLADDLHPPPDVRPVLLVCDDFEARLRTATTLMLEGYDVASAGDGIEALADLEVERPSIIVADLARRDSSAFALRLGQLRSPLAENVPVLWYSPNREIDLSTSMGVFQCVQRPVTIDRLLWWIAALAEDDRPRAAPWLQALQRWVAFLREPEYRLAGLWHRPRPGAAV